MRAHQLTFEPAQECSIPGNSLQNCSVPFRSVPGNIQAPLWYSTVASYLVSQQKHMTSISFLPTRVNDFNINSSMIHNYYFH